MIRRHIHQLIFCLGKLKTLLTDIVLFDEILTTFRELAIFFIGSLDVRAGAEVVSGAVLATLNTDQVKPTIVEADTKKIFSSGITKVTSPATYCLELKVKKMLINDE